jgi:hypothetical protein
MISGHSMISGHQIAQLTSSTCSRYLVFFAFILHRSVCLLMIPALIFPIVRLRTQASAIPGLEFCDLRDLLVSKHLFCFRIESSDVVTFSVQFSRNSHAILVHAFCQKALQVLTTLNQNCEEGLFNFVDKRALLKLTF